MSDVFTARVPLTIGVVGASGIGKTAILGTVAATASREGWTVFQTACRPAEQRRPLKALTDILLASLSNLGSRAQRYTSGLEAPLSALDPAIATFFDRNPRGYSLSPARFETLTRRLLEGVLVDHAVQLVIDDAHWMDPESRQIFDYLAESLAGARFALLFGEYRDPLEQGLESRWDQTVALERLDEKAGRLLLSDRCPAAPPHATQKILELAEGLPINMVLLAEFAEREGWDTTRLTINAAAAVEARLEACDSETRRFLQVCSLLGEPISYRILAKMFGSESEVTSLVAKVRPDFLIAQSSGVSFRHSVMAEAVRRSIEVELPLRRDILDALLGLEELTLEESESIGEHAELSGDRELAFEKFVELAQEAYRRRFWRIAADHYERALKIRRPSAGGYAVFFSRYVASLRALDRESEAEHVLRQTLRDALELNIGDGVISLAALLVNVLLDMDEVDRARATYDFYRERARGRPDEAELLATGASLHATVVDVDAFRAVREEFDQIRASAPVSALGRINVSEAMLLARIGNHEGAKRAHDAATALSTAAASTLDIVLPLSDIYVDFQRFGPRALREHLGDFARRPTFEIATYTVSTYLSIVLDFAQGSWDQIVQRFADVNIRRFGLSSQTYLFSSLAAMAAFAPSKTESEALVADTLERAVRAGYGPGALQLASWSLAAMAARGQTPPAELLSRVMDWAAGPSTIYSFFAYPIAIALYGERANDSKLLERIAERHRGTGMSEWLQAHDLLARGYAMHALGAAEGVALLRNAAARFTDVDAGFFAAFAAERAGIATSDQTRLLHALGVVAERRSPAAKAQRRREAASATPTVRELEVARLISEGKTNREAAETLFLSERTIEVHLGNLFSKLGVTSRTQLARWVLENDRVGLGSST